MIANIVEQTVISDASLNFLFPIRKLSLRTEIIKKGFKQLAGSVCDYNRKIL